MGRFVLVFNCDERFDFQVQFYTVVWDGSRDGTGACQRYEGTWTTDTLGGGGVGRRVRRGVGRRVGRGMEEGC